MGSWSKIKTACKYADVSERTFRKWLRAGLRHSRLPSGTLLIKMEWIDQYLKNFEVVESEVDKITEEICSDF
jgi:predicted site-specific integrase-resolvase